MDRILKNHFDKFRDRGVLPPELKENPECVDCKLFADADLLEVWRNNRKGLSWVDQDGNELHGAIDNILVHDGKLVVLDYKTRGYPLKEDTHEFYTDQMNLYNFLLRKNGYDTENYGFLLFYISSEVTETGEVIFDTKLVKMTADLEAAGALWKQALQVLNGDCPQDRCEWCETVVP